MGLRYELNRGSFYGLVCMTELVEEYINFMPDHPFINVNKITLKEKIIQISKIKKN